MNDYMTRTESEYERRLLDRVAKWEAKNAAEAAELRLVTQRKIGMTSPPPVGGIRWMVLEQQFREAVREKNKWPTMAEWIRGQK